MKKNIEKKQITEKRNNNQLTINDIDPNGKKEKLIINKNSEDSSNGSFRENNKIGMKIENLKNNVSRNGKQYKANLEKDITVLSILDNPNLIKDNTSDSNIMSTNRDNKYQEKSKMKNSENKKEIDLNDLNKFEIIESKAEQEKTQSTKTHLTIIEKGNTVNEKDIKRTKFFEKMNGLMKSNTNIGFSENGVSESEINNKMSHTMKIVDKRNSINIKQLINNLENHMLGK